jgi:hypothetical protein
LGEGFERGEDVVAEAGVAGRGFVGGEDLERHGRLRWRDAVMIGWFFVGYRRMWAKRITENTEEKRVHRACGVEYAGRAERR